MLDEAIPALLSTVQGWFSPWVLFLVLNLVIGTIIVTSRATPPVGSGEGAAAGTGGERRNLSRAPSTSLDRLRSFDTPRFTAPSEEAPVAGALDLESDEQSLPPLEIKREDQGEHAHMGRSMSEAAVKPELPRLPARLRKSASDKSAFARFVAEEDAEVVEARRPSTTRDAERRRPMVAEPEEPASEEEEEEEEEEEQEDDDDSEVDARADDFINKFRQQLKMQRIDSFVRYRDTVRRGQATVAA